MNAGRLLLRFALPLVVMLGLVGYALSQVASQLLGRWFRADIELRSQLIFNSLSDRVVGLAREGRRDDLEKLFRRVAEDERVLAIGLCLDGDRLADSGVWPITVGCPTDGVEPEKFREVRLAGGEALISVFPSAPGLRLVVAHDLSFIERRSAATQNYLAGLLAVVGAVAAGVTVLVARVTLRRWLRSVRDMLSPPAAGAGRPADAFPDMASLAGDIRQILRDLDISRRAAAAAEGVRGEWSAEALRRVLDSDLPGAEVIVVSNREPYIHNRRADGKIELQHAAGGVVTALEPVMRACGGVWIAHGSGSADREMVDAHDHFPAPPEDPTYTLRRVWLSEEEENGYYYGLANEGLWPLCHVCFVRPVLREGDWAQYVAVNRKFADAVAAEAKSDSPVVLVQDYHFALLPRMVRDRLPGAVIVTFWHIPWPNAELFSIFPWREALLNGLLGSSIIGFHTRFHCQNFIDTVDRFVECHIDREDASISVGGHGALVRPYPISIEWPATMVSEDEALMASEARRAQTRAHYGVGDDMMLAVGVERLDFTKGIPDRFAAVEAFLERHPEWAGRFVFLQAAAPTRSKLPAYQAIQDETVAAAEAVNAKFAGAAVPPIILAARHHEPEEVTDLFRAADICVVSSLHDGMNLVAKEFVAARNDEQGVLILSTFAGASRELLEALIVNPYDVGGMAEALRRAVNMSPEDQRERMSLMRGMVRENNVFRWAGRMLLDAARLRKRWRIAHLVHAPDGGGRK